MNSRTLVFGDIHGGLKALVQLIEIVKPTSNDKLIFLGDYVDGWSESAQTIDYLIRMAEKNKCTFIKGNHDLWCEQWLACGEENKTWILHGGKSTVVSYLDKSFEEKKLHLNFFEQSKFYYIDDANRLFIHAGFTSMHGPENEFYKTNLNWDRTLWEMALTMDKRIKKDSKLFPKRLLLYNEIYIGHTPTIIYDIDIPIQGCNVWNIDTGAGFTGRLTCIDAETKQFWQSDKLIDLYPNEKGRN